MYKSFEVSKAIDTHELHDLINSVLEFAAPGYSLNIHDIPEDPNAREFVILAPRPARPVREPDGEDRQIEATIRRFDLPTDADNE